MCYERGKEGQKRVDQSHEGSRGCAMTEVKSDRRELTNHMGQGDVL